MMKKEPILIEYDRKFNKTDTPEYNYEEFKRVLQDIMGPYTQLEFSEITGIANSHISRVLNGHRTNQPTLKSVHKIAKAAKNPDQILSLFKATGYLQEGLAFIDEMKKEDAAPEAVTMVQKTEEYEQYHRILHYLFCVLEDKRGIKSRSHDGVVFSNQLYYELQSDLKEWHFFIADQSYESRDAIYKLYGMIASIACFKTTKFSIITKHKTVYDGFTKIPPHNLNANISVILLSDSGLPVEKECSLSSTPDPLPDELVKKLDLVTLYTPPQVDFFVFPK